MIKKMLKYICLVPIAISFCSFTYGTVEVTIFLFEKWYSNNDNKTYTWPGHSFLNIVNNYSYPLYIGPYVIGPFVSATLGCWGNLSSSSSFSSTDIYEGIYLDNEAYIYSHYENMIDCYQYTFDVNVEVFNNSNVSTFINNNIDHYDPGVFNCTCFVIDFIKCISKYDLYSGIIGFATPGGLKQNMKKLFGDDVVESNTVSIKKNSYQKYIGKESTMLYF